VTAGGNQVGEFGEPCSTCKAVAVTSRRVPRPRMARSGLVHFGLANPVAAAFVQAGDPGVALLGEQLGDLVHSHRRADQNARIPSLGRPARMRPCIQFSLLPSECRRAKGQRIRRGVCSSVAPPVLQLTRRRTFGRHGGLGRSERVRPSVGS